MSSSFNSNRVRIESATQPAQPINYVDRFIVAFFECNPTLPEVFQQIDALEDRAAQIDLEAQYKFNHLRITRTTYVNELNRAATMRKTASELRKTAVDLTDCMVVPEWAIEAEALQFANEPALPHPF